MLQSSFASTLTGYIHHLSLPPQADNDTPHFQTIAAMIKRSKSGKKIGVFTKDNFTGLFVEGWRQALKEIKVSQVDISAAFAFACAAKDDAEINIVKVSTALCWFLYDVCEGCSYRKPVR